MPNPTIIKPEPCGVTVTCKCRHTADLVEFQHTPVAGELPRGHFQCPLCKRAWKIQSGPARVGWSGMALPGETKIVDIQSAL